MVVRPMNDWVLVRYDQESRITSGGIIKPEGAHDDVHEWGTVVAIGPGRRQGKKGVRCPVDVVPGDRVLYIKFLKNTGTGRGIQHTLEDGTFLIQEKDIIVAQDGERAA